MCLLQNNSTQNQEEELLYVGGSDGIIYIFYLESNEILDMLIFK